MYSGVPMSVGRKEVVVKPAYALIGLFLAFLLDERRQVVVKPAYALQRGASREAARSLAV